MLEKQLKAETSLLEQRLAFSEEARATSNIINVELENLKKRFEVVEAALAKSDYASLTKSVPEIRNSIGKVDAANNTLSSTLSAARQSLPLGTGYPVKTAIPIPTAIPARTAIPVPKVYGTTLNTLPDDWDKRE